MFSFSGHLRDEDEWALGSEWGNPCGADTTSPCPGVPSSYANGQRRTTRRIDMAAVINERQAHYYDDKDGDVEKNTSHTRDESFNSGSMELKSNDSGQKEDDEDDEVGCLCFVCSPCLARTSLVICTILILFITGLGVGLAVYDQDSRTSLAAGANGDAQGNTTSPTPAPTTKKTPGPTSIPIPGSSPGPTPVPISGSSPAPTMVLDWNFDDGLIPDDNVFIDDDTVEQPVEDDVVEQPAEDDEPVTEKPTEPQETDAPDGGNENPQTEPPQQVSSPYLVGVYYYPWHGSNFHNGDGYMRKELSPQHQPTLGEYDDSKAATISQHLAWSRQANIGLWVTSWWGPNRLEDSNTKDVIMEHTDLGDLKIALHYETTGRLKDGLTNVVTDMEYMCENYWDHPNYYKINNRPVLFVYVTRKLELEGTLEGTILAMRTSAGKCGHDVYLVGDHVFEDAPEVAEVYVPFWYFDAVTNYDVYGSMGRPSPYAGASAVDTYYSQQAEWRSRALESNCHYVPTVSPGYNDRGVRLASDHPPLSRKLTGDSEEGSLFAYQLSKAKTLVDPDLDNLLVVNSFNEWHEDTQIEPAIGELTNLPDEMTQGVYYEGYGELYLNLLRENTLD